MNNDRVNLPPNDPTLLGTPTLTQPDQQGSAQADTNQPPGNDGAVPQSVLQLFRDVYQETSPPPMGAAPLPTTNGGAYARTPRGTTINKPSGLSGTPSTPSPLGCNYNHLKLDGSGSSSNRQVPPALLSVLKPGDVIYFNGVGQHVNGHAEMYIGRDSANAPQFRSDADQGDHFFAAEAYTKGSYVVYRNNDPAFQEGAVSRIQQLSDGRGYGGRCAEKVRIAVEGSLHHSLGDHPGDAAGYNQTDTLQSNNFQVVARGGPSGIDVPETKTVASKSVARPTPTASI